MAAHFIGSSLSQRCETQPYLITAIFCAHEYKTNNTMFMSNSCISTMDSDDSSDFQLLFLHTDKYCENTKWKVRETEVQQ